MLVNTVFAAMAFSAAVTACRGTLDDTFSVMGVSSTEDRGELRLLKTSEEDPGTWVTEEEKVQNYIMKHVHFVDVTDTTELEEHRVAIASGSIEKRQTSFPSGPSRQSVANPLIAQISQTNPQGWARTLTDIYNRYYRGSYAASSATTSFNLVKQVAAVNSKVVVKQVTHSSFNQPSVIATIPGTSASVIVVSCHFDSINQANTAGRAPGGDDNASGFVTILEALRVLAAANYAPKNTLEFHFYAGEEGGLLGSRAIMQDYVRRGVRVLALMNQDMTAYSPGKNIAVYTDYVSTPLSNFIRTLVPVYTALPVVTDRCGYGCSDHASATDAGYPAAYVCDEIIRLSTPYIHTAQDTYATMDFSHLYQHVRLTVGFLVEASYF